jgi:hypothetical protein
MADDYQKMADHDATTVWVMQNRETARDVVEAIQDKKGVYSDVRVNRTADDLKADLKEKYGEVMLLFTDIDELIEEVEQR